MTKVFFAVCAGCETRIVLPEEQAILHILGHLAGFLPSYHYFCPNCLPN